MRIFIFELYLYNTLVSDKSDTVQPSVLLEVVTRYYMVEPNSENNNKVLCNVVEYYFMYVRAIGTLRVIKGLRPKGTSCCSRKLKLQQVLVLKLYN